MRTRRRSLTRTALPAALAAAMALVISAAPASAETSFTSIFSGTDPRFEGAGWAACSSAITWGVDASALSPRKAREQVANLQWAMGAWAEVTGLTFEFAGTSDLTFDEPSFALRGDTGPSERHIRISFVPDRESTRLTATEVGLASPSTVLASRNEITSGTAVFNADYIADAPQKRARALILHEIGHVLGLGHTDDVKQVMAPDVNGLLTLGPGDIEGVRSLLKPCAA